MGKKDVLEIIRQFRAALQTQGIGVSKIILYGSWARGNAHADSDIDVVVISRQFEGKEYWERITIISEAIYKIFAPIEAVAMTPQEWESGDRMICAYAKDGEVLVG